MRELTATNPEVAAATMAAHLDRYVDGGRPGDLGLVIRSLDQLRWVVAIPARRTDSDTVDRYHLLVDASFYDLHPPVLRLVAPPADEHDTSAWEWPEATPGTRHWPVLASRPRWFQLHDSYKYEDGSQAQLLCFSFNADYYRSNHRPHPGQVWVQGRHTVAASLNRMVQVLNPPHYGHPSDGAP